MSTRAFSLLALSIVLGACTGEVASEETRSSAPSPSGASDEPGAPAPAAPTEQAPPATASSSTNPPPPPAKATCTPDPAPFDEMSCVDAEKAFSVVATALTWTDPSTASLDILYRDESPRMVWSYPGVRIVSSDPRVTFVGHTPSIGSGPDLYTVGGPCDEAPSRHALKLTDDVPSGTKITLTLSPVLLGAVDVTDAQYSECGGKLQKATFDFIVP